MPDMTSLEVGDRLVYPNQGLCTVTDIKTEEIAGQKLTFVSLVINETQAKVKVPQDKLIKNGIRRVSSQDEVEKVVAFLKSADSERASLDWKKRARDNTARLSEGGLIGLAEVVKGLQVLSELRQLPPKEREQYNDARHLFIEELAAAMGVGAADAEDACDILLFPPGKERPKRSVEEFQGLAGEEGDELGLDGDLLGLDGEEPAEEKASDDDAGEEKSDDEGEEAPKKGKAKKADPVDAAPKKRGRPPKPKPESTEPPPPPKKRGRPPKPKPETTEPPPPPKKRGRPPKAK